MFVCFLAPRVRGPRRAPPPTEFSWPLGKFREIFATARKISRKKSSIFFRFFFSDFLKYIFKIFFIKIKHRFAAFYQWYNAASGRIRISTTEAALYHRRRQLFFLHPPFPKTPSIVREPWVRAPPCYGRSFWKRKKTVSITHVLRLRCAHHPPKILMQNNKNRVKYWCKIQWFL